MRTKEELKKNLDSTVVAYATAKRTGDGSKRFSKEQRERLFSMASSHFSKGEYDLAAGFFRFLVLIDPQNTHYWSSLEECQLLVGEEEGACL